MSSCETSTTIDLFSKYFSSNWECGYSLPFQMWLHISPDIILPVFKSEKKLESVIERIVTDYIITLMIFITRVIFICLLLSVL